MYLVRPPYLLKQVYPGVIWRKDPSQKKIYLTFDDGPIPAVTSWVLDVLKNEKVSATFFCVGENVEYYPELFRRIKDEGHQVGNHTYNHLKGWDSHSFDYLRNVQKCNQLVNSELFRPPYGRAKKTQLSALRKQYSIIMWDLLSGDFDKDTSPEQCLKNVTTNLRNGSIVVFHDSMKAQKNMEYALPRAIAFAKGQGYEFGLL